MKRNDTELQVALSAQLKSRSFGLFVSVAVALAVPGTFPASASTIIVNPGPNAIASGIAAAGPGDTVQVNAGAYTGGITLNKSIAVVANGAVVVTSSIPQADTAITLQCDDCGVSGITFLDFGWAVSPGVDRSRVTLTGDVFRRSGTVWVRGDSWLVANCEIDRPMVDGLPDGVEDYMGLYGNGHVIRHNYFHGLNLNTDLAPGVHNDAIQTFTEGGLPWQFLTNTVIEENIFADFLEAIWISNGNSTPSALSNIVVRSNVFWGQDFAPPWLGPVQSSGCAMFQSDAPGIVIQNNLMHHAWNAFSLYAMTAVSVAVQGNIEDGVGNAYSFFDGTPDAAVNRGTVGNIFWSGSISSLIYPVPPDRTTVNPQLLNPNAVSDAELIGTDGVPWTADDAWRPQNLAVMSYGPQIGAEPPLPPPGPPPQGAAGAPVAGLKVVLATAIVLALCAGFVLPRSRAEC